MNNKNILKKCRCWLIQSGTFKSEIKTEITGRNSIIDLDYIYDSEFESSALSESTQRMLVNIDFYDVFTFPQYVNKDGDFLKVYAPKMFIKYIEDIVSKLADGSLSGYLKAPCTLQQYLRGANSRYDFWWDIKNDFYIFFGDKNEKLILEAQKAMRQGSINDVEIGNWDELSEYYLLTNQDLDEEAMEFLKPKKEKIVKRLVRTINNKIMEECDK